MPWTDIPDYEQTSSKVTPDDTIIPEEIETNWCDVMVATLTVVAMTMSAALVCIVSFGAIKLWTR